MRQLYVCSRPLLDKDGTMHQHLIGVLSKLDNDEYRFEYKLDNSIESSRLLLPIFPDINKVYNDAETRVLLDDYLPSENDTAFIAEILKKSGMKQYDEWTWLLTFESDDANAETFLYEELPNDVIRHDIKFELDDEKDFSQNNENSEENADNVCTDEADFDNTLLDEDFIDELPFDDIETESFEKDNADDNFDTEFPEDSFDDVLVNLEDNDSLQTTVTLPNNMPSVIKTAKFIEKLDPKPQNTVKIVTIQTTRKRKKQNDIDDFIEPPPESPFEKIQQRLLENQRIRQERLAEQLKTNPYTN